MSFPNEVLPYVPLIGAFLGLLMAIITGAKFFYRRYTSGLDSRISKCINENVIPIEKVTQEHETRIQKMEQRLRDFRDYFIDSRHKGD